MIKHKVRKVCKICFSKKLIKFLSLGKTPLADRFVTNPQKKEEKYPLNVVVCTNCWLVQLVDEVNSELLFGDDYAFYTSGSPSSIPYFDKYAKDTVKMFPKQSKKVLEIASNDGLLLKYFKKYGSKRVLGIDPAKNVVAEANKNGIPTIAKFFNKKNAQLIKNEYGGFGVISANNVVAHVTDLHDFMQGVSLLLQPDGVFVFEVQYFPQFLKNNQFDNVYHEHRSYFSLLPLIRLMQAHNMEIFRVQKADTQGGSIRVFASKQLPDMEVDTVSFELFGEEIAMGINKIKTYKGFQKKVEKIKRDVIEFLKDAKRRDLTVYGYGASAKGNTFLNYCGIDGKLLKYIVDKTPYKIGKYTPGTHIRVIGQTKGLEPDIFLLLVWNYLTGVIKREKKYLANGGMIAVAIPKLTIYKNK